MARKFITRAALARRCKLSRARITQLVQQGIIRVVDPEGRFLLAQEATAQVRARLDKRIKLKQIERDLEKEGDSGHQLSLLTLGEGQTKGGGEKK